MSEQLYSEDEALAPTEHEKILVVGNGAAPAPVLSSSDLDALLSLARAGEAEQARTRLQAMVDNRHYRE